MRLLLGQVTPEELRDCASSELAGRLEAWRPVSGPGFHDLLRTLYDAQTALAASAVPVLLLKGFAFAQRLYGGWDRRPQFDVDILVQSRHFGRATEVLGTLGFARDAYDLHSRTVIRDGCKVDVHRCLRHAPAFRVEERAIWASAIDVDVNGVRCRTLSDEWSLVLLVLASFEDLGQGTATLKSLLDLYLFIRTVDSTFDWPMFLERRRAEGLLDVGVNVLALTVELFDARGECPRLASMLDTHAHRIRRGSHDDAVALVFGARKGVSNLRWFASVYPGSLIWYLARFWVAGFPRNAVRLASAAPWKGLAVALSSAHGRTRS